MNGTDSENNQNKKLNSKVSVEKKNRKSVNDPQQAA